MAEWNSCAELVNTKEYVDAKKIYSNLTKDGDPLQYMLEMQYDLQMALANKSPEHNKKPSELSTVGNKFDWLRENKQAFDDEYREIIDALPGMSLPDKDRSAVWKKWKSKYDEIRARKFSDLTDEELVELKMEFTDSFFFFLNMFFALDMNAEDLFTFYYVKCAENHNRAKTGY